MFVDFFLRKQIDELFIFYSEENGILNYFSFILVNMRFPLKTQVDISNRQVDI